MVRMLITFFATLSIFLGAMTPAAAQFSGPFPAPALPPLTQVGMDAVWGPICAGIAEPGFGPAACSLVQRELAVRQRMVMIGPSLTVIGPGPFGPVCNGPLGPGPCVQVARYLAMQQLAQAQFQLTQVGTAPGVGPICMGPLGPGPCEAVRLYLMQASLGAIPAPGNLQQPQLAGAASGVGPMCATPTGPAPCSLLGQFGLDRMGMATLPTQASFGVPAGLEAAQLGAACAQQTGIDVAAFAACTGQQVVLTGRQQALIDCAANNSDKIEFAKCAAAQTGLTLSDGERVLVNCALPTNGDFAAFAACAGGSFASRTLTAQEQAVLGCAAAPGADAAGFATCAAPHLLRGQQKAVLDCAVNSADVTSFAGCAAPYAGVRMSDDQRVLARCALTSGGDASAFGSCAGAAYASKVVGPEGQAALACAASANGDHAAFAGCAATKLLGGKLSKEQQIAIRCAAESGGDAGSFAGCAAANMFGLQLNPEQQIAVQCLAGTGGTPPAAAGCIASRLTLRELTKCMTDGIGGRGCFGDSNDLVGKNGFVRRTFSQVLGGPNSVFHNPDQIWGGDNSFVRNPGQIFGGPNSFVRNPGQIFGGPNSVFNNPGQLLPKPKPLQVGSIGGKRICLPWC